MLENKKDELVVKSENQQEFNEKASQLKLFNESIFGIASSPWQIGTDETVNVILCVTWVSVQKGEACASLSGRFTGPETGNHERSTR